MLVLYVEDEANDYQLVSRYFSGTPHQLMVATTIDAAAEAMAQAPQLVLVDMMLGQAREGADFVRTLRTQGYTQPVVAVTGLSLPTELEEMEAIGCTEVLSKPYTIRQLADTVNKYLS
jgi:CheY-like chemotaxis protein